AAIMKVDASGLEKTVLQYNRSVQRLEDDEFRKSPPAYKIAQGPFYAVRMALLKHTRRNGIRVNTRGQVIDRAGLLAEDNSTDSSIDNEKVIPHLYAAGECAHYLGRYHSHGTLGIYSFYGRIVGKNVALEKPLS